MALILSARRGWLPAGFTELEYIECSGTQYVRPGLVAQGLSLRGEFITVGAGIIVGLETSQTNNSTYAFYTEQNGSDINAGETFLVRGAWLRGAWLTMPQNTRWYGEIDWQTGKLLTRNDAKAVEKTVDFSPGLYSDTAEVAFFARNSAVREGVIWSDVLQQFYNGKFCWLQAWYESGVIARDFVPVLDRNGIPCLYDKISKRCFYNIGSGTFGYRIKTTGATSAPMSLRDPYYTAPSGVYARPSGENQLEILADTEEPAGDGWEWFANTGDAYEHFGITQEELLTNEPTND